MAKYLYLLEDVYVIMHYLKGTPKKSKCCDICFKKGENYYWLDESCVQLKRVNNRYYDNRGETVALIPLSDNGEAYYNKDLPYIGGKRIKADTETMNGKVYVSNEVLQVIKNDYNCILEKGIKKDIMCFKADINAYKAQFKKTGTKVKVGR